MQKHNKPSFKEEIKTYVRLAMNSTETRTLDDVVEMLKKVYLMDIRLKGNTINYALPTKWVNHEKHRRSGGSKLGSRFTVEGIRPYMQEKEQKQVNTDVPYRILKKQSCILIIMRNDERSRKKQINQHMWQKFGEGLEQRIGNYIESRQKE